MTDVSPSAPPRALLDIPFDRWVQALGLSEKEAYRARQVQNWVFAKRARSFSDMTDLPADLRSRWEEDLRLRTSVLEREETSAEDGTARLFFKAADGREFSAVFLPSLPPALRASETPGASPPAESVPPEKTEGKRKTWWKNKGSFPGRGGRKKSLSTEDEAPPIEDERASLCLSTQVGCAWGCVFCASGRVPFQRNLTPSEILEQIFAAEETSGRRIQSILFMGMGEPLANYDNLRAALNVIRSPLGLNLGARHVTVSTTGLAPAVKKLAEDGPKVNLAISLHAADDETRKKILPKSSAWPLKDLLRAAWDYQKATGGARLTFEYILLDGINDSIREAQRLSNLLRGKKAWVNLIAYNPVPGLPYRRSSEEATAAFAKVLEQREIFVRIRKPQGTDIAAGCGQLGEPVRAI